MVNNENRLSLEEIAKLVGQIDTWTVLKKGHIEEVWCGGGFIPIKVITGEGYSGKIDGFEIQLTESLYPPFLMYHYQVSVLKDTMELFISPKTKDKKQFGYKELERRRLIRSQMYHSAESKYLRSLEEAKLLLKEKLK